MKHITTSKPLLWKMDSSYKLCNRFNAWTWLQSIGPIFLRGAVSCKMQHLKSLWKYFDQPKDKSMLYNKLLWGWIRLGYVSAIRWHSQILADILKAELAASPMLERHPRTRLHLAATLCSHMFNDCSQRASDIATSCEWRLLSNGACTTTPLQIQIKLLVENQENRDYE